MKKNDNFKILWLLIFRLVYFMVTYKETHYFVLVKNAKKCKISVNF